MKAIVWIGAAVLLFYLLQKKKTPTVSDQSAPPVATVDYGAMGGFDFGSL